MLTHFLKIKNRTIMFVIVTILGIVTHIKTWGKKNMRKKREKREGREQEGKKDETKEEEGKKRRRGKEKEI